MILGFSTCSFFVLLKTRFASLFVQHSHTHSHRQSGRGRKGADLDLCASECVFMSVCRIWSRLSMVQMVCTTVCPCRLRIWYCRNSQIKIKLLCFGFRMMILFVRLMAHFLYWWSFLMSFPSWIALERCQHKIDIFFVILQMLSSVGMSSPPSLVLVFVFLAFQPLARIHSYAIIECRRCFFFIAIEWKKTEAK